MPKKHILDCDNDLWRRVRMYSLAAGHKNVNETCVYLLEKALGPMPEIQPATPKKKHAFDPERMQRMRDEMRAKLE